MFVNSKSHFLSLDIIKQIVKTEAMLVLFYNIITNYVEGRCLRGVMG